MPEIRKTLLIALQAIVVIGVIAVIYGLIVHRRFTIEYIFTANIIVATIVLCVALLIFMLPAGLIYNKLTGKLIGFKPDKLTDHSTYMERRVAGQHMEKQKKAYEYLFLGLAMMIITGVLEFVFFPLLPGN